VKVLSANETVQQIQLSSRRARLSQSIGTNGTLIKSVYSVGSIISGKISGFASYGAFIVFDDGITGLLHANAISRSPLDRNITQLFRIGQRIKVAVASVDPVAGRCGLSTKEFEESAGDILLNATEVFENAELVFERFETSDDFTKCSDRYYVIFLQHCRRLKIKQQVASMKTAEETSPRYLLPTEGSVVSVKVSGISPTIGVYVLMEDGRFGLIKKHQISREHVDGPVLSKLFHVGQRIKSVVICANNR
jgi:ribosomal protein S1